MAPLSGRLLQRKTRPLLFVDIDGVLNPYGVICPEGYVEHRLFADDDLPVRVCQRHAAWLRDLAETFDLVWGTSWSDADRALLATVLDLPPFVGAMSLPAPPFDPALKVPAIEKAAGNRPVAWLDDQLTPDAWWWARARRAPTLLIAVDPDHGLQRDQVNRLLQWSRKLRMEF